MIEKRKDPRLYIVIPCYNEEEVLPVTAPIFRAKIEELVRAEKISWDSKILFVNDGSKDKTWQIICELNDKDCVFTGITQSRNRGHQNAVLAGLMEAKDKCDIAISIDCDGQDDINAIDKMVDEYLSGSDVVYGVRSSRKTDTFFKRFTAQSFYKLLNVMGTDVIYNHADYRLMSSRILQALAGYEEVNLFLRGLIPLIGFKSSVVEYERHERIAGKSHYPLKKMIALAVDGITSMSVKPLSLILFVGFLLAAIGFAGLIGTVLYPSNIPMLIVSVIAITTGIQTVCSGIMATYIGKIYMETKHRPRYIISDRT